MNDSQDYSLDSLEIYIHTFADLVEKYQKRKTVNKFQKDEFYSQYVELEDKILSILDSQIKNKTTEMNKLVDQFVIYWRRYQETWTEENWNYYNKFALLNKSIDKNQMMSNNNNEIYINKNSNINYINNLMKADIKELNNSGSEGGSIKENKSANKNEDNLLSVKNLNKYNNLAFSNDKFIDLNEDEKLNSDNNNKYKAKDPLLKDKNKKTSTRYKNLILVEGEFEEIELAKRNEISTDSNETYHKGKLNIDENKIKKKDSKAKSKLIEDIDKEIDMHFHSENNCNSYLYLRKGLKNQEEKNNQKVQKDKKCRMCVECSIY